jgi:hypothetical protein
MSSLRDYSGTNGLFPQISRPQLSNSPLVIERLDIMYPVGTVDINDYFSGLVLMTQLYQLGLPNNHSIPTFRIIDTRNSNNYEIISPLAGFALGFLPVELTSQILLYYPADWYLVSKDCYDIVKDNLILDTRIRKERRTKGAVSTIVKYKDLSRHQTNVLVDFVNSSESGQAYLLLGHVQKEQEVLMKAITDKFAQTMSIVKYFQTPEIVEFSTYDYLEWLLSTYDDIYYNEDNYKLITGMRRGRFLPASDRVNKKIIWLLINRIALYKSSERQEIINVYGQEIFAALNTNYPISVDDLYKLTHDIISNKGILVKSATNPFTGKTRKGYIPEITKINVGRYLSDLLSYISYNEGPNNRLADIDREYTTEDREMTRGGRLRFKSIIFYLLENFDTLTRIASGIKYEIADVFMDIIQEVDNISDLLRYLKIMGDALLNDPIYLSMILKLTINGLRKTNDLELMFHHAAEFLAILERILIQYQYSTMYGKRWPGLPILEMRADIVNIANLLPESQIRYRYLALLEYLPEQQSFSEYD